MKNFVSFKTLLPKLYNVIPGLLKGTYYCITGGTGTGKTKLAKYLFLFHIYNYCKKNDKRCLIIWFALEEPYKKFWASIEIYLIKVKYDLELTYYQYLGFHEGRTEEHDKAIESIRPIINDMKRHIIVTDKIDTVDKMKTFIEKIMSGLGSFKTIDEKEVFIYDKDIFVTTVLDHVSLLEGNDLAEEMRKWSQYVVRTLIPIYDMTVCNVHQQIMTGDDSATYKNDIYPTKAKLADNKRIGRDYHVIFGLFNPFYYGLKTMNNQPVTKAFRSLHILKHRDGEDAMVASLHFNGATGSFKEI